MNWFLRHRLTVHKILSVPLPIVSMRFCTLSVFLWIASWYITDNIVSEALIILVFWIILFSITCWGMFKVDTFYMLNCSRLVSVLFNIFLSINWYSYTTMFSSHKSGLSIRLRRCGRISARKTLHFLKFTFSCLM